jgi:hypothetical protein
MFKRSAQSANDNARNTLHGGQPGQGISPPAIVFDDAQKLSEAVVACFGLMHYQVEMGETIWRTHKLPFKTSTPSLAL